jgi:glutamate-1-semialdehyde 2,1-aminomutase
MKNGRSKKLYARASRTIPGGVNSPVRAWQAVGGVPLFIARGHGARITDVDDNGYVDFVGSWGPLVLGHRNRYVQRAIREALLRGTTFGAPTKEECILAELVCKLVPSIEKLRLVSSGTEATMSAIRLARAFTGRVKIVKFDGCYHGHADGLLVKAGSGIATLGLPDSPGVIAPVARETIIARFNDPSSVDQVFARFGKDIAAVIVEPVCGNIGVVPPLESFLPHIRSLATSHGSLLIFDEVITGFRLSIGGAQKIYQIKPDLTCLGKIMGGGLPLAAFGGRRDIMDLLAPQGPVYQAGTLSGNPLAVSAGLATLEQLSKPGTYEKLDRRGRYLAAGFTRVLTKYGIKGVINCVGSMLTLFFGVEQVRDADDARQCDREQFSRFFHGMLDHGLYLPPSPFEALMISLAHSRSDLNQATAAFDDWAAEEANR